MFRRFLRIKYAGLRGCWQQIARPMKKRAPATVGMRSTWHTSLLLLTKNDTWCTRRVRRDILLLLPGSYTHLGAHRSQYIVYVELDEGVSHQGGVVRIQDALEVLPRARSTHAKVRHVARGYHLGHPIVIYYTFENICMYLVIALLFCDTTRHPPPLQGSSVHSRDLSRWRVNESRRKAGETDTALEFPLFLRKIYYYVPLFER